MKLQTSVITKVKTLLGVTADIEPTELYDLLYDYRNTVHPDKFTDDKKKIEAEEKFKEIGVLLSDLNKIIEGQKLEKKPSELIPYQKQFELIQRKQEIVTNEEEIKSLQSINSLLKHEIKSLRNEVKNLRDDRIKESTKELIDLYKPKKKGIFSPGLAVIGSLITLIVTKIEEVATVIFKYSPISEPLFNGVVFTILIGAIILLFFNYQRERILESYANTVKTPKTVRDFYDYITDYDDKKKITKFTETQVFEFIEYRIVRYSPVRKIFFKSILRILDENSIDKLKDIFIYNLLSKQLIEVSTAENMDRTFNLSGRYSHLNLDDIDLDF